MNTDKCYNCGGSGMLDGSAETCAVCRGTGIADNEDRDEIVRLEIENARLGAALHALLRSVATYHDFLAEELARLKALAGEQ
jgi:hypothetical protein